MKIAENETVQVMLLGNKAVVKGYEPDVKDDMWLWIFPIVFGAIGIFFLVFTAKGIRQSIIMLYGTPGTGRYVSHTKGTFYDQSVYNIAFSFENKRRKTFEDKSGVFSYIDEQTAKALIEKRSFPIKYIGKKAMIILDQNKN
jgi:hypothetical protein